MMEEWHQKLHNNTSPDDVVICKALLAYLESGLDIKQYWNILEVKSHMQEHILAVALLPIANPDKDCI